MRHAPVQENNSTVENDTLNQQFHTIRNVHFVSEGTSILCTLHIYVSKVW
jgi:hypothetical protein